MGQVTIGSDERTSCANAGNGPACGAALRTGPRIGDALVRPGLWLCKEDGAHSGGTGVEGGRVPGTP
jgi:hypothetical protein